MNSRKLLGDLFIILVGTALCLLFPLYNGAPFFYPDSFGYIGAALNWKPDFVRASTYHLPFALFQLCHSRWLWIIAQSAFSIGILLFFFRIITKRKDLLSGLLLILLLIVLTPFGLFSTIQLADFLVGFLILSLYILIFHTDQLSWKERALCAVVFLYSLTAHQSHILIGLLLFAFLLFGQCLQKLIKKDKSTFHLKSFLFVGILLVTGGLCLALQNAIYFKHFRLANRSGPFLFARFQQCGLLTESSKNFCSALDLKDRKICKTILQLPAGQAPDNLLWKGNENLNPYKIWEYEDTLLQDIVKDAAVKNPSGFIECIVKNTYGIFFRVTLVDVLWKFKPAIVDYASHFIDKEALQEIHHSRQQREELPLNYLHTLYKSVYILSLLLLFTHSFFGTKIFPAERRLTVYILIAFVVNALVMAGLSSLASRYMTRALWLLPFGCYCIWYSRRHRSQ